ncbi:hypothetical protein AXG93_4666s1080 [Marchantia polymorpha subsp. ruderalis]|uniref:Uncharacterized protein n=1 Tax=Marchantia polymorpha subsp. ruderalis TaxID=1480154 RepID=A0A176W242_MARPO|nr:hypothetical protein AXG93_4666s1080 [Marchantia polymorpha subsp. ruderalis]
MTCCSGSPPSLPSGPIGRFSPPVPGKEVVQSRLAPPPSQPNGNCSSSFPDHVRENWTLTEVEVLGWFVDTSCHVRPGEGKEVMARPFMESRGRTMGVCSCRRLGRIDAFALERMDPLLWSRGDLRLSGGCRGEGTLEGQGSGRQLEGWNLDFEEEEEEKKAVGME